MPAVSTSIGTRFENILLKDFPDFYRVSEDPNLPDFFNGCFWIEAKVGFLDFGVRLKEYQVDNFKELNESVIYIIGFHKLKDSMSILWPKTEKQRQDYLKKISMFLERTLYLQE